VTLPDGSVLQLNTDSVVETAYSPTERRVRLKKGEAFFSVAKNPQRPFWVDVGAVSVRAVGTAFNVRFRPEAVEVLVKEGKVSVNQATLSHRCRRRLPPVPRPRRQRL
jgi:transmembrane sensor